MLDRLISIACRHVGLHSPSSFFIQLNEDSNVVSDVHVREIIVH